MEAILKYWSDRFTPEELIDHIGISMEDLLWILDESGWVEANLDCFREDFEKIYQVGEYTNE